MIRALLVLAAFAMAAPASAGAAVFADRDKGFKLAVDFRRGDDSLVFTIPKRELNSGNTYFVHCGKTFRRRGELVLGVQPITPKRRFESDQFGNLDRRKRRCRLEINDEETPAAKFRLVRRR